MEKKPVDNYPNDLLNAKFIASATIITKLQDMYVGDCTTFDVQARHHKIKINIEIS